MASTDKKVLLPGVSIRPILTEKDVDGILRDIYGLKCVSIKELNGYDDKNYHVQVEGTGDNKNVKNVSPDGYILKVVNTLDSDKPQFFEAQNEMLIYLGTKGICCPQPVQSKNDQYYIIKTFSSGKHIVRLLEFIKGSILHHVPSSNHIFYESGKYVAQLDEALKGFHHSAYKYHKSIWHLESVPQLSDFLYVITDENRRKMVEEIIEEFSERVVPVYGQLEKGMIHGDFNEQNILVEEKDNSWFVKGILDFGDSHITCYTFELAIAMTYIMIQGRSIDVGGHVLAGYSSIRNLPPEEFNLLKVCISGRLCQSLVLGAYSSLQDPENSYILVTSKPGWALLEELWALPEDELLKRWQDTMDSYTGA